MNARSGEIGTRRLELFELIHNSENPLTPSVAALLQQILDLSKDAYDAGYQDGQDDRGGEQAQGAQDLEDILRFNGVNCRN